MFPLYVVTETSKSVSAVAKRTSMYGDRRAFLTGFGPMELSIPPLKVVILKRAAISAGTKSWTEPLLRVRADLERFARLSSA